jgi:hypothetical protein
MILSAILDQVTALGPWREILPSHWQFAWLDAAGQPTPYDWFPSAALIVVVVAAVYAYILNSRDPGLAGRVGSIVADE